MTAAEAQFGVIVEYAHRRYMLIGQVGLDSGKTERWSMLLLDGYYLTELWIVGTMRVIS